MQAVPLHCQEPPLLRDAVDFFFRARLLKYAAPFDFDMHDRVWTHKKGSTD